MLLPSPLSNVLLQQANQQVLISWDYQVGSTYKIQVSLDLNTWIDEATTPTTSYLDTSVTVGTQYYYRVAGVNGAGVGPYSAPQSIVPVVSGDMTLGQLRLLSQQKADRVNSQFVTTVEWNTYINQSLFELYDILIQKFGNEYYVAPPLTLSTDGTASLPLPNGINYSGAPAMYKLLGVDLQVGGVNGWLTLKRYMFIRRNDYIYPQLNTNLLGIGGMRYREVGDNINFIPYPSAGQLVRLWYIPRMVSLLRDSDIAMGVSGWCEYVAVDAAIKALMKEESDVSALLVAKQALLTRIEAAAENRDAGEPETISRTRSANGWGWGGDYGGGDFGPMGGI